MVIISYVAERREVGMKGGNNVASLLGLCSRAEGLVTERALLMACCTFLVLCPRETRYILRSLNQIRLSRRAWLFSFFFSSFDLVHLDGFGDEQYACSVVLFLHGVLLG